MPSVNLSPIKRRIKRLGVEIKHNAEEPSAIAFRTKTRKDLIMIAGPILELMGIAPASINSDNFQAYDEEGRKQEGGFVTYSAEDGRKIHKALGLEIPKF